MAPLTCFLLAVFSLVLASLTTTDVSAYGVNSCTDHQKPNILDQKPKLVEVKPDSSVYKQKPIIEKPKVDTPSQDHNTKPSLDNLKPEVKGLYKTVGVQGIVYCKSGDKLIPLEGAVTRITCSATDKNGYESDPFTILSKATDKKGYFLATVPASELERKSKVFRCKAFLDKSPLSSCNVPTDINKGLSGCHPYSAYHLLSDKKMKLYTVGPFVYTSTKPKFVDEGY